MSHGLNIHDGTGIIARDPAIGILHAYGSTVPAANTPGYAPGCRFMKTNGNSIGTVDYVNVGTKTAANFVQGGLTGGSTVSYVYGDASAIDGAFFVADRDYLVTSIIARVTIAGTDVSAVTGQIRKANNGTAIASGAVLHSGTINLKGTIETNQVMTLNAVGTITITNRFAIGLDVTGVTTAARGVITVAMVPL